MHSSAAGGILALCPGEHIVLKAIALTLALAVGQNGTILCLAQCETPRPTEACHQTPIGQTLHSNADCLQASDVAAVTTDNGRQFSFQPVMSLARFVAFSEMPFGQIDPSLLKSENAAASRCCPRVPLRI